MHVFFPHKIKPTFFKYHVDIVMFWQFWLGQSIVCYQGNRLIVCYQERLAHINRLIINTKFGWLFFTGDAQRLCDMQWTHDKWCNFPRAGNRGGDFRGMTAGWPSGDPAVDWQPRSALISEGMKIRILIYSPDDKF